MQGMYDGLLGREQVMKQQLNTEQKKRDEMKEMQKLSEGKTTFKSLLKSKSKKEESVLKIKAGLEIADKEIADYKLLTNFLSVYHGSVAIPKFKKEKSKLYLR